MESPAATAPPPDGGLLAVIGAGGHAACVGSAAREAGWNLAYFVDEFDAGGSLLGVPVLSAPEEDTRIPTHLTVAVGDNWQRATTAERMSDRLPASQFAVVIHPRAIVDPTVSVSGGAVVLAGAVVGPRCSLAAHALVSESAVITHDCELAAAASVGPGGVLCGRVRVGGRTAVGAGATVREKTTLGEDTVVGGASFVAQDLPARVTAYGVPCRVAAGRAPGDAYLR